MLELLRHFLPFAEGVPSHDQLGILFANLDMEAFQHCFMTRFMRKKNVIHAKDGCAFLIGDFKNQMRVDGINRNLYGIWWNFLLGFCG